MRDRRRPAAWRRRAASGASERWTQPAGREAVRPRTHPRPVGGHPRQRRRSESSARDADRVI